MKHLSVFVLLVSIVVGFSAVSIVSVDAAEPGLSKVIFYVA